MTYSQLLARLKNESKYKIMEGGGVRARSLVHNTLKGRRVCWSSGMGLGRVDKLHSLTRACTQPTQDSSRPVLTGSHHLPPYSILCTSPRGPHPNDFSFSGLPLGSPEIAPVRTSTTLEPHNFASRTWIEVRSKEKL